MQKRFMFGLLEKVEKAILKQWEKNEHFTVDLLLQCTVWLLSISNPNLL